MSQTEHQFKEGQAVWHKGRRATFLYYVNDGAATIRFEGHTDSTVVSTSGLSASPDTQADR
jgi:hypothetical protein